MVPPQPEQVTCNAVSDIFSTTEGSLRMAASKDSSATRAPGGMLTGSVRAQAGHFINSVAGSKTISAPQPEQGNLWNFGGVAGVINY